MANYTKEIIGQEEFYRRFALTDYVTIDNNTDGYLTNGGAIFEFKCLIERVDEVLFQAIKYLSRLRIKGMPVHKHIILVSLNDEIAYCYDSAKFLKYIEKVYVGSASKHNDVFSTKETPVQIRYGSDPNAMRKLLELLDIDHPKFTKIHIDLNCVVGWANRFYRETKKSKIDMFEELRHPNVFRNYIHPWRGQEDDFKFIMDCLNDLKNRRELGAFYTPRPFAKKAAELVRSAIDRVPENTACTDPNCPFRVEGEQVHKHYVILDRCAGTGVLQEPLSSEELEHTVLATYELKEWVVLNTIIGDKVKAIIPPTQNHENGLLVGGDALACCVFPEMEEYVQDPDCSVIMFENPPYTESGGRSFYDQSSKDNQWKSSLVCREMNEKVPGVASNEKSNVFIWSAFEYYLKKEHDSYILFSPVKYWKNQHLVNREFLGGFFCNRDHFGTAGKSTISVIHWGTRETQLTELPPMPAYDIRNEEIEQVTTITVKKSFHPLSEIYDKKANRRDVAGLVCTTDGYEVLPENYRTKFSVKPLDNDNIIAYLATHGFAPNSQGRVLTRVGMANGHGFFLRRANFLKKLPLFAAACFPENTWYRKDVYAKTSDGGLAFERDRDFLKSCLIFTCLSSINKCISFDGSNGKLYLNELCFDEGTLASETLAKYKLTREENILILEWEVLMETAKECDKYNPQYKYGVYQIETELNERIEQIDNRTGQPILDPRTGKALMKPKYPLLNGKFTPLKKRLSEYYARNIEPKLFRYGLIK
ncbi:MAG: hypothetical protein IJ009_00475 [Clostridia bacterium]|nr:hypothetical protein [Clostridia bacterium]